MLNTLNLIQFFNESFNENNISVLDNISKINYFNDRKNVTGSNTTLYSNKPTNIIMLSYNKIKNINLSKNKFINNRCIIGVEIDENKFENILDLYNSKNNVKNSNITSEFLKTYDNEFKCNDIFKYNNKNNNEISPIIQKNSYNNNDSEFCSNQDYNSVIFNKNQNENENNNYDGNNINIYNKEYKNNSNDINNINEEVHKNKNIFYNKGINNNRKSKKHEDNQFKVVNKSFEYKMRKKEKKKPDVADVVKNYEKLNENNININHNKKTNLNKSFDNYRYFNKRKKTNKMNSKIEYNNLNHYNNIYLVQNENSK